MMRSLYLFFFTVFFWRIANQPSCEIRIKEVHIALAIHSKHL